MHKLKTGSRAHIKHPGKLVSREEQVCPDGLVVTLIYDEGTTIVLRATGDDMMVECNRALRLVGPDEIEVVRPPLN